MRASARLNPRCERATRVAGGRETQDRTVVSGSRTAKATQAIASFVPVWTSASRRPDTDPLEREVSNAVMVDPTLEPSISAKAATNGKDPFDTKPINNQI